MHTKLAREELLRQFQQQQQQQEQLQMLDAVHRFDLELTFSIVDMFLPNTSSQPEGQSPQ
jgi:hypothetical protein